MLKSSSVLASAGATDAELKNASEGTQAEHSHGEGEVHMSRVCPLDDNLLPIAADGLRLKQVSPRHTLPLALHTGCWLAQFALRVWNRG